MRPRPRKPVPDHLTTSWPRHSVRTTQRPVAKRSSLRPIRRAVNTHLRVISQPATRGENAPHLYFSAARSHQTRLRARQATPPATIPPHSRSACAPFAAVRAPPSPRLPPFELVQNRSQTAKEPHRPPPATTNIPFPPRARHKNSTSARPKSARIPRAPSHTDQAKNPHFVKRRSDAKSPHPPLKPHSTSLHTSCASLASNSSSIPTVQQSPNPHEHANPVASDLVRRSP